MDLTQIKHATKCRACGKTSDRYCQSLMHFDPQMHLPSRQVQVMELLRVELIERGQDDLALLLTNELLGSAYKKQMQEYEDAKAQLAQLSKNPEFLKKYERHQAHPSGGAGEYL